MEIPPGRSSRTLTRSVPTSTPSRRVAFTPRRSLPSARVSLIYGDTPRATGLECQQYNPAEEIVIGEQVEPDPIRELTAYGRLLLAFLGQRRLAMGSANPLPGRGSECEVRHARTKQTEHRSKSANDLKPARQKGDEAMGTSRVSRGTFISPARAFPYQASASAIDMTAMPTLSVASPKFFLCRSTG